MHPLLTFPGMFQPRRSELLRVNEHRCLANLFSTRESAFRPSMVQAGPSQGMGRARAWKAQPSWWGTQPLPTLSLPTALLLAASPRLPAGLCTGAETGWLSPAEEAFPPCARQPWPWASSSSSLAHPSNQEGIQGWSQPPAIALAGRRPPALGVTRCSSARPGAMLSLWESGAESPFLPGPEVHLKPGLLSRFRLHKAISACPLFNRLQGKAPTFVPGRHLPRSAPSPGCATGVPVCLGPATSCSSECRVTAQNPPAASRPPNPPSPRSPQAEAKAAKKKAAQKPGQAVTVAARRKSQVPGAQGVLSDASGRTSNVHLLLKLAAASLSG